MGLRTILLASVLALVPLAASSQPAYPLACRGGGDMHFMYTPFSNLSPQPQIWITFARASQGVGSQRENISVLQPGQCSWLDRAISANEPNRIALLNVNQFSIQWQHGQVTGIGSNFPHISALQDEAKYQEFDVYNNGSGYFVVATIRSLPSSPKATAPPKRSKVTPAARPPVAFIQDPAIRVPIGCTKDAPSASCGEDLTLADARNAYEKAADAGVLTSMVGQNVCRSPSTRGFYYGWAPVERLSDAAAALTSLTAHVRDGQPFNGEYVMVDSDLSTADEQHVGLCQVTRAGEAVGPPRDCVTVAIISRTGTWFRTGAPRSECFTAASFRPSGAIDIKFDVVTTSGPQPFSTALLNVLKSDLKLEVSEDVSRDEGAIRSIRIQSATGLRNSQVLAGGWREAVDFTIFLSTEPGMVSVNGTAHALVARQALGSLSQYQGMDDAQRTTYANFLNAKVNSAIRGACKHYLQRDDKTIHCD